MTLEQMLLLTGVKGIGLQTDLLSSQAHAAIQTQLWEYVKLLGVYVRRIFGICKNLGS